MALCATTPCRSAIAAGDHIAGHGHATHRKVTHASATLKAALLPLACALGMDAGIGRSLDGLLGFGWVLYGVPPAARRRRVRAASATMPG